MSAPVVAFKKPPTRRPGQTRKRSTSPTTLDLPSDPSSATSAVIRPTKKSIINPLVQGTKRRRDANEGNGGGLEDLEYRADEGLTKKGDEYATRDADWDLEVGGESRVEGKKIRINEVSPTPPFNPYIS
jgi:RING finger protein 113A